MQFEGETGPYVQYTHARAMSILRKANHTVDTQAAFSLTDDDAWEVLKTYRKLSKRCAFR